MRIAHYTPTGNGDAATVEEKRREYRSLPLSIIANSTDIIESQILPQLLQNREHHTPPRVA
jgi:hypothetical protein